MPGITQHQSKSTTKLLLIGPSGSGKSGSLMSLAQAGYNLRVIDLDNGMDIIRDYATNPKSPYKLVDPDKRINYVTLTDEMRSVTTGPESTKLVPKKATVWPRMTKLLTKWVDGDIDLGPVSSWGPKDILVIDSLSMLSRAAKWYNLAMQGNLLKERTSNEDRRDIGGAQALIRSLLELLYDESIKCNVIVTSHVTYNTLDGQAPKPNAQGEMPPMMGFPTSIGRALSDEVPRFFNSMLICRAEGTGQSMKRKIYTVPVDNIAAKSSAPMRVQPSYDISNGLAEYFKAVRGE